MDDRIERATELARRWKFEESGNVWPPRGDRPISASEIIDLLTKSATSEGKQRAAGWWTRQTDDWEMPPEEFAEHIRECIEDIDLETDGGRCPKDSVRKGYALAIKHAEAAALQEIADILENQP